MLRLELRAQEGSVGRFRCLGSSVPLNLLLLDVAALVAVRVVVGRDTAAASFVGVDAAFVGWPLSLVLSLLCLLLGLLLLELLLLELLLLWLLLGLSPLARVWVTWVARVVV